MKHSLVWDARGKQFTQVYGEPSAPTVTCCLIGFHCDSKSGCRTI